MKRAVVVPFRRGRPKVPTGLALAALLAAVVLGALLARDWPGLVGRIAPTAISIPAQAGKTVSSARIHVIDGDTIDLDRRRIRLVGFNAPETWAPACPAEAALGERAKARLRQLVESGPLAYRPIPCSCAPGSEGTRACNHGRACGVLLAGARDIGDILVAEGLAVYYRCGRTSCPPPPRPWCG